MSSFRELLREYPERLILNHTGKFLYKRWMKGTFYPPLKDKKPKNFENRLARLKTRLGEEPYRIVWNLDIWGFEHLYSHETVGQIKTWVREIVGDNYAFVKLEAGIDARIHLHFLTSGFLDTPDWIDSADWNVVRIGTEQYPLEKAFEYLLKASDARATNKNKKYMRKGFVNAQEDYIYWGVRNRLEGKRNPNCCWEVGTGSEEL